MLRRRSSSAAWGWAEHESVQCPAVPALNSAAILAGSTAARARPERPDQQRDQPAEHEHQDQDDDQGPVRGPGQAGNGCGGSGHEVPPGAGLQAGARIAATRYRPGQQAAAGCGR